MLPRRDPAPTDDEEMARYRRPFAKPGEDRRPTLTWPRQIPLDGRAGRRDGDRGGLRRLAAESRGAEAVRQRPSPGRYPDGDALAILPQLAEPDARSTVPGMHFLQEDSPDEIGQAIAAWLRTLPGSYPQDHAPGLRKGVSPLHSALGPPGGQVTDRPPGRPTPARRFAGLWAAPAPPSPPCAAQRDVTRREAAASG